MHPVHSLTSWFSTAVAACAGALRLRPTSPAAAVVAATPLVQPTLPLAFCDTQQKSATQIPAMQPKNLPQRAILQERKKRGVRVIEQPSNDAIKPRAEDILLIDESPHQFLPSLGQIYDSESALILQQLHYKLRMPFFKDRKLKVRYWQGRFWVRIEAWMWWDEIDGITPYLKEDTWARRKAKLEKAGVLLTTNKLNSRPGDRTLWFSINYNELNKATQRHREIMESRRAEREQERQRFYEIFGADEDWKPGITPVQKAKPQIAERLSADPQGRDSERDQNRNLRTGSPQIAVEPGAECGDGSGKVRNSTSKYKDCLPDIGTTEQQQHAQGQKENDVVDVDGSLNSSSNGQTEPDENRPGTGREHQNPTSARKARQRPTQRKQAPKVPDTPAMPGTAVVATGGSSDAERAQRIAAIANRLAELGVAAPVATKLAEGFPETHLDAEGLHARLVRDYRRAGLRTPVADQPKRTVHQFISQQADEIRWQLILWPARPEAGPGFAGNATGAFLRRVDSKFPPEPGWLERITGETARAATAALQSQEMQEAMEYWQTLTEEQRQRFQADFKVTWMERNQGVYYNRADPAHSIQKARELNDPRTRTWLASLLEEPPTVDQAPTGDGVEFDDSEFQDVATVSGAAPDLDTIVAATLDDLRDNLVAIAGLDQYRADFWQNLTDKQWAYVAAQVQERWAKAA